MDVKKYFVLLKEYFDKYLLYILAAYMSAILIFSTLPPMKNGLNSGFNAHLFVYFILSLLMSLNLTIRGVGGAELKGAILAGSYGLLMELVQYYIPYRDFEISDIMLNYISACIAILPAYYMNRWLYKKY